jgi:hypothetical protein
VAPAFFPLFFHPAAIDNPARALYERPIALLMTPSLTDLSVFPAALCVTLRTPPVPYAVCDYYNSRQAATICFSSGIGPKRRCPRQRMLSVSRAIQAGDLVGLQYLVLLKINVG